MKTLADKYVAGRFVKRFRGLQIAVVIFAGFLLAGDCFGEGMGLDDFAVGVFAFDPLDACYV